MQVYKHAHESKQARVHAQARTHTMYMSCIAHPSSQTIGQIAAQWKVIADANVEGAAPTVYILNEVTRRAIIIGDWPQSPYSPNSAGVSVRVRMCL